MSDSIRPAHDKRRDARPVLLLLTAELARSWVEPALPADVAFALPGLRMLLACALSWTGMGIQGAVLLRATLLSWLLVLTVPCAAGEPTSSEMFSCPLAHPTPGAERC